MKMYSLFSKSLKRYNLPLFADNDDEAIATVSRMVTAQQDPSLICALDDLKLVCVGEYDQNADLLHDESPVKASSDGVLLVFDDLHTDLPLPPTVKERIDKYYGGTKNA